MEPYFCLDTYSLIFASESEVGVRARIQEREEISMERDNEINGLNPLGDICVDSEAPLSSIICNLREASTSNMRFGDRNKKNDVT